MDLHPHNDIIYGYLHPLRNLNQTLVSDFTKSSQIHSSRFKRTSLTIVFEPERSTTGPPEAFLHSFTSSTL